MNMENKNEFDFFSALETIIKEIEVNDDYDDNLILKKLIFYTSCEIASFFMDDIFLILKLKFSNFEDNKKYNKVMLDILYQILKQFSPFPYKAIVNLYETLSIGNFETESMIFFFRVLLTFYFTHQKIMIKDNDVSSLQQYEIQFKKYFNDGLKQMNELINVIPMIELNDDKEDKSIEKLFRIEYSDEKKAVILRPLKVKGYNNTSMTKSQDTFFLTTDGNNE